MLSILRDLQATLPNGRYLYVQYTSLQINACTLYSIRIYHSNGSARTHAPIYTNPCDRQQQCERVFMSEAWPKPRKANLGSTDNGTRIMLCVLKLACIRVLGNSCPIFVAKHTAFILHYITRFRCRQSVVVLQI